MKSEAVAKIGQGHIGINRATGAIQFTVPRGTSFADAIRALGQIDLSVIDKLPKGCHPCLTGFPFDIRDEFEDVINVRMPGR